MGFVIKSWETGVQMWTMMDRADCLMHDSSVDYLDFNSLRLEHIFKLQLNNGTEMDFRLG